MTQPAKLASALHYEDTGLVRRCVARALPLNSDLFGKTWLAFAATQCSACEEKYTHQDVDDVIHLTQR